MKERVQLLRIPNHLEMLGDSLWAINAMVIDGKMQAFYLNYMEGRMKEWVKDDVQDVELLLDEWLKDVDSAAMDVEALPNDILDWTRKATTTVSKSNLSRDGAQVMMFRHFIRKELKEGGDSLMSCWSSGNWGDLKEATLGRRDMT
ncbi:disease resistance protein RGA3 [Canna indica]|uniref:Disease resistance protein RGA3 n=1 Tax=Canna indica TaxID=4628 RepID=A0AAQ3KKC9_9LILI|nr:disease resistance protein RGA3 [Canna indica]